MSRLTSGMKLPKQFTFVFVASIVFCTAGSVYALSFGGPGGAWPKTWPKELEPLRKQASTWYHGQKNETGQQYTCYNIPFANRKEFESAWPHILTLTNKGVPVTLFRGPMTPQKKSSGRQLPQAPQRYIRIGSPTTGGVTIVALVEMTSPPPRPAASVVIIGIELVVDGDVVDLNRISLPADTPIIDKRQLTDTDRSSTEVKSLSPATTPARPFEPLRSGTWRGKWDHKVDGKVVSHSWWDLQLDFRNDSVTGHVLEVSDGSSSDSILSGQVITAISRARSNRSSARYGRFVSVLILRHDTSENGYFVINTAHRVAGNRFLGTWVDSIGQVGDFELTLTEKQ